MEHRRSRPLALVAIRRAAAVLLALGAAACTGSSAGQGANPASDAVRWVGTWGMGPTAEPPAGYLLPPFENQTLRQIVHTSIGGSAAQVRLSNEFGNVPLVIGAARIGLRESGSTVRAGTSLPLTFGGRTRITIPVGAAVLSDAVHLAIPPLSDVAVSIYLPGPVGSNTNHLFALQTSFVAPGDVTDQQTLSNPTPVTSSFFITGLAVWQASDAGTVVTLGDSITDGIDSGVDENGRWTDVLALRFQQSPRLRNLGVVNVGIGGNRLLHPSDPTVFPYTLLGAASGPAALERFDRDVLAQPGVAHVIVLLGVNDLGWPGAIGPADEEVTAEELIQGYRQLIARAHQHGIRIHGATILPFAGCTTPGYFNEDREARRQAVNAWIRTSGEYDGVIDFDAVMRDPAQPNQLLPAYAAGDHLHPNDAGHQAMGQAVPLGLFGTATQNSN